MVRQWFRPQWIDFEHRSLNSGGFGDSRTPLQNLLADGEAGKQDKKSHTDQQITFRLHAFYLHTKDVKGVSFMRSRYVFVYMPTRSRSTRKFVSAHLRQSITFSGVNRLLPFDQNAHSDDTPFTGTHEIRCNMCAGARLHRGRLPRGPSQTPGRPRRQDGNGAWQVDHTTGGSPDEGLAGSFPNNAGRSSEDSHDQRLHSLAR